MRFLKFCNEKTEAFRKDITFDEVKNILKKDCKKFLNEVDLNYPLYRGITEDFSLKLYKMDIDKNRKSLNMNDEATKFINDAFKSVYGFYLRKQCLFVTGNFKQALIYGDVFYVFPIGNYEVYWSKKIKDLYEDGTFLKQVFDTKIKSNKDINLLIFSLLYSFYNENQMAFYQLYLKNEDFLVENYGGIDLELKSYNRNFFIFWNIRFY